MTTTSATDAAQAVLALTADQIGKVYSGKPGCGCGCKGKYWVHPAHATAESAARGYPYEGSEISLRQVERVLALVKARATEATETDMHDGTKCYAVEDDNRYLWIYTAKGGSR